MRCPDCSKFVAYDEPEVEVGEVSVSGDAVTVDATVSLNCGECGALLKQASINAEATIEHACGEGVKNEIAEGDERYEIESDGDATGTDRTETKDAKGRTITNARYMKRYYGFELSPTIKCLACDETFDVAVMGEEQASAFEEQT